MSRPPHIRRRAPGLTLIEMLVVLGLIMVMLGMGAATYYAFARSFTEEGYLSQIDVMLRQIRNSAVSSRAPAYLEISYEPKSGNPPSFTPWATKTIAQWHFEDVNEFGHTSGPRHDAVLRGAKSVPDGKIGKGVRLSSGAYIDAGSDPDFDLDDGGCIEAYIKPDPGQPFTGDNFVFCKTGSYAMRIGPKGTLIGEIGATKTTPQVQVKGLTYRVVPGRWTKVALSWDRNITRLMADDTIIGTGPGARAPLTNNPLWIGHDSGSLDGLVDEVRISAAVSGGTLTLPRFTVTHNTAPWNAVYFAEDGSLDLRFHPGPVQISIEKELRKRTVVVDMLGMTTRLPLDKGVKPVDDEAKEALKAQQERQAKKIKLKE